MFVAVVVTTIPVSVEVIVNGVAEAYAVDDDPLHTVFCTPKLFEPNVHEFPDVSMFEPMFPVSVTINNYCSFTVSNTAINFGSMNPGTTTATTANGITVTDTGNIGSNILTSGNSWVYNSNSMCKSLIYSMVCLYSSMV